RSVLWVLACCNTILGEHGEFLGALGMLTDITGRKQGEAALLEDQDRLRCFFDAAHAAIVIHDNGCILDANQALADMFGYGLNEMIGRHTTDFAAPEARELVRAQSLSGDLQPYEVIGQRKDGSTFPIEVHVRNIHYHGRNVRVATLLDITDRNRADEVARKLASIVESSDDAIFSTTPAGIIVRWNRGAERAHGFSATEIQGQALDILLPVERRSEAAQFLDRVRRGERIDYFETTWLRNDGKPVQVGLTVSPLKDSRGQVTGALVVGRDLAARKRAEDTLHGSQRLLRDVMEGSTDAFYIKDQQGRYVTINSAGARMLGKTVEDVIGKDDMELFSEETAHEIMERDLQVLVSGETRSYEERGTAAGKTRTFFTTKGPYRNSKGAVVGLIGISRDI